MLAILRIKCFPDKTRHFVTNFLRIANCRVVTMPKSLRKNLSLACDRCFP